MYGGIVIVALVFTSAAEQFSSINGLLCVRNEFVNIVKDVRTDIECSILCDRRLLCQGFTMADGFCKLFVFDKCSKHVRECNCTRVGRVFVRQQPGLPGGALCPSGFTDSQCGTKYKTYPGIKNWDTYKGAIDAESGLVIMADAADSTELGYLKSIMLRNSLTDAFLGGRQLAGSVEPAGGWQWSSCGTSISSSLWNLGEPSNGGGTECVTMISVGNAGLNDGNLDNSGVAAIGCIGECVSPFE